MYYEKHTNNKNNPNLERKEEKVIVSLAIDI